VSYAARSGATVSSGTCIIMCILFVKLIKQINAPIGHFKLIQDIVVLWLICQL